MRREEKKGGREGGGVIHWSRERCVRKEGREGERGKGGGEVGGGEVIHWSCEG